MVKEKGEIGNKKTLEDSCPFKKENILEQTVPQICCVNLGMSKC